MSMNTKKNISIVLLVLALLLWLLRKMNVLYIPGLSMVLLGLSMIMVGIMMFQVKQKKKLGGTLILAFGLFCIVTAVMEIKGYFAGETKKRSTRPGAPLLRCPPSRRSGPPIPIFCQILPFSIPGNRKNM